MVMVIAFVCPIIYILTNSLPWRQRWRTVHDVINNKSKPYYTQI